MALVTAEDIRRVAERVRAEAKIVPPYERRKPYDSEIFEPLMTLLPEERVPFDPPPRRSDETEREYYIVWRNHYNLWLLQDINDYFKVKDGRLPSPSSDIDDDDDVRAQDALYNQNCLLGGMKIVDDDFFRRPAVYEDGYIAHGDFWKKWVTVGKEETFISPTPQSLGQYMTNIGRSIEDDAGLAAEQQEMDGTVLYSSIERSSQRLQSRNEMEASKPSSPQNIEPTLIRKRRRLSAEDNAPGIPFKKQRTDKHPQLSTALNTAGYKRKRNREKPLDKPSSTGELGQPSDKKRRLNEEWKTQTPQKRKRGSQQKGEELRVSQLGYEVPETKRRRLSKAEVTNAEQSVQDAFTAVGSRRTLATAPSLRITRARRQQLSGEDAQLLQLDQRGKPDVQEPKHAAQEPARELRAINRNSRRPKKTASMDVKNYHQGQHEVPPTKASTTVNTTTKTIARTRFRSAPSKTRSKGRLSST
ncbi:hypothetical protein ACQKWADRAFT_307840 [Trichoderma austrokoningii]